MARAVTSTFDDQMKAAGRDSTELLEITLPLKQGESQPVIIFVAKRLITVGAQIYTASIREFGEIAFTDGDTVAGVSGSIENASGLWGSVLSESDRTLDGARVLIKKAVKNAAGAWETDTVLPGVFRVNRVNGKEVRFTVVSYLSLRGAVVADDEIGELPEMGGVAERLSGGGLIDNQGYPEETRISFNDRRLIGGSGNFLPVQNLS